VSPNHKESVTCGLLQLADDLFCGEAFNSLIRFMPHADFGDVVVTVVVSWFLYDADDPLAHWLSSSNEIVPYCVIQYSIANSSSQCQEETFLL
jgi:hypothetical protein